MKTISLSFASVLALCLASSTVACMQSDVGQEEVTPDAGRQMPPADAGTPDATPPADNGSPLVCGDRLVNCSGVCRDLTRDGANCGGCGLVCGTGTVCTNSVCVATQPADAGVTPPPPPADAGTSPAVDEWRLVYRAPSGVTVVGIQSMEVWDGSARECTLSRLDPAQMGTALVNNERCPTMRFPHAATLRFNARFTMAPTSSSAPMALENWSCHIDTRGGPMLPFGTVEAYRNGTRVELRMVDNDRGGCNWAPVGS